MQADSSNNTLAGAHKHPPVGTRTAAAAGAYLLVRPAHLLWPAQLQTAAETLLQEQTSMTCSRQQMRQQAQGWFDRPRLVT